MIIIYIFLLGKLVKMQAASIAVRGNLGFEVGNRRVLAGFGEFRKRRSLGGGVHMSERSSCFGLRFGSDNSMRIELGGMRNGAESVFGSSSVKNRSVRAQAAGLFFLLFFLIHHYYYYLLRICCIVSDIGYQNCVDPFMNGNITYDRIR